MGRVREKKQIVNKKERAQNFTPQDIENYLEIVFCYQDVVLSKCTDVATNKQKLDAWTSITNDYNSIYTVSLICTFPCILFVYLFICIVY